MQACKHPLEIVGEGDIVDLNDSGHGCTLEQYQSQDEACTENNVSNSYFVSYQAVPKPGWEFVRWDGPCSVGIDSHTPLCQFAVTSEMLEEWEEEHPGVQIPATVAVFQEVDTEVSEAEAAALELMRARMKAFNQLDAAAAAETNNYPHYRLAGEKVAVFETPEEFIAWQETFVIPFFVPPWHRSQWEGREIIQSSKNKVHVTGRFSRYDAEGNKYQTTEETLWIITKQDGKWGLKLRSSFLAAVGVPD